MLPTGQTSGVNASHISQIGEKKAPKEKEGKVTKLLKNISGDDSVDTSQTKKPLKDKKNQQQEALSGTERVKEQLEIFIKDKTIDPSIRESFKIQLMMIKSIEEHEKQ